MQEDMDVSNGVRGSSTTGGYTPMNDQEPSTSRGTSFSLGKITTRNEGQLSQKRSADTSDDDPNTPTKKSRSTEGNQELIDRRTAYPTGGLTRNFHGVVYQLKHLGFTLCRAMELDEELPFYLSSERMDVGQFDDLVLEYSINGSKKTALFVQLKHIRDETKKVKAGDLLEGGKNDNFLIPKYFNSWREMNRSKQFNVPKKMILGTNIGLDSEDLRKAEISYKPIDMSDKGFEMIATKDETECYKFIPDSGRNRKLYDKLKQMSDVHILARKLAEHVCGSKKLELRDDIFRQYHVALGNQVIDIRNKRFRSDFIKGPKKPSEVSNFHRIFCDEFSNLKSSKTQKLEDIRINVSNTFGIPIEPLKDAQLNSNFKLPDDEITDDNVTDFLELLNLVVNLPNEVELGEMMKDEVSNKLSLLNADLIGSTFLMRIIEWFKGNGQKVGEGTYLSYAGGKNWIGDIETQVANFMSMGLSSVYCEELEEYGIDFKGDMRSECLRNFLYENEPNTSTCRILILKAPTETLLSTLRVYGAVISVQYPGEIRNEMGKVKRDSFIFIRLRTLLLPKMRKQILAAFQSKQCHNLLVIECDSSSMKRNPRTVSLSLGGVITSVKNANNKIILIIRGGMILCHSLAEQFESVGVHYEDDDEISFIDFTPDSRRNLLEKKIINFQGNEERISFAKLLGIEDPRNIGAKKLQSLGNLIDSRKLVDLVRSNEATTVTVGNDLEGLGAVKDYYINRSFFRLVIIKREILEDEARTDRLVFSGINRNDLPETFEKYTILDRDKEEEKFANLCKENKGRENIHWLKAESGKFIWKKSTGDISYLLRYRDAIDSEKYDGTTCTLCNEDEFATHDGPAIISDTAGMGKSTVMTYLAGKLKEAETHQLVLRIDLLSNVTALKKVQDQKPNGELRKSEQAIKFLVNNLLKKEDDFSKRIFKSIFDEKLEVAIIFDGFDEISPAYENIVVDLLHGLVEHGVRKLFVATRPHTRETLETKLNTFSHRLQPFSHRDQEVFLTKFWKKGLNLVDCDRKTDDRISTYAKAILKKLADASNDLMCNFTGIPLQTRLVAEIFQNASEETQTHYDSLDTFVHSTKSEPRLPDKLNLIDLYAKFMDKKLDAFLAKFLVNQADPKMETWRKRMEEEFLSMHTKLALDTLFNQEHCERLMPSDSPMRKTCDLAKKYKSDLVEPAGIITEFIDGVPHFGHRTFAEYLAAKYLFNKLKQGNHDEAVRQIYVADIFLKQDYGNLRVFMNCLFSDEHRSLLEPKAWQHFLNDLCNDVDQTVFHRAAAEGNARLISLFIDCFKGEPANLKTLIDQADKYKERALCLAAKYGHVEEMTLLVENGGCEVNYQSSQQTMLLVKAAGYGKLDVVRCLVEHGASVNSYYAGRRTPLHAAVCGGEIEVVKYLVERGANVNSSAARENTPLHDAAFRGEIEVVKYLVERGANVNSTDDEGTTMLHNATVGGKIEIVKYFVERGASVNSLDAKGETPLHTAADSGKLEVVKYLVKRGANVNSFNAFGHTPLHKAARTGKIEVVKYLVERGVNVNCSKAGKKTPLHNAAFSGEIEVVKYLVERGANVNSSKAGENSPLYYAARGSGIEVVKYLVERGANVNSFDAKGNTPLLAAARNGKIEVVKYLVERGANVNSSDTEGNTLLHNAAFSRKIEVVKYLVERGANVNSPDAVGNTPLHKAARGGEIEVVKYLVERGANVNSFDAKGKTPLHAAARSGKIEVVKYLVERGANVHSSDAEGNTPLHEAARGEEIEVVKYLVERGANIDSPDAKGNTPLHEAALWGEIEVVKYLVERGANVDLPDSEGNTPLLHGNRGGETELVKYLVELKDRLYRKYEHCQTPLVKAISADESDTV